MLLIGRVSGLVARPRPPRGALSARVVSMAPASDGRGRRETVCTGRRGGRGKGWPSIGAAGGDWCAVKYWEIVAEGCLIGMESDTLI